MEHILSSFLSKEKVSALTCDSIETALLPLSVFIDKVFYCWDVVPNPTKGVAFGNHELLKES